MNKLDKKIRKLLKDEIKDHKKGKCSCDFSIGGKGYCIIGQYVEGIISAKELSNEIFY